MLALLWCNLDPFYQDAYRLEIIFISAGYNSALQSKGLIHETNCVATVCSMRIMQYKEMHIYLPTQLIAYIG